MEAMADRLDRARDSRSDRRAAPAWLW